MTLPPFALILLGSAVAAASAAFAETPVELQMPFEVDVLERETDPFASYALPTGPFGAGGLPVRAVEGAVDRRAYRLDAPGAGLMDILVPLREQLVAAGFQVIFECEARACGGFDFRFATEVIPEPAMHVDLGEFRFLSATRGGAAASLLVSRSAGAAFVQVIQVGAALSEPDDQPATDATDGAPAAPGPALPVAPIAPAGSIEARLDAGLPVVLDDLVFASGASDLQPGDYASLKALADWLAADPARRVTLVGHTDAQGDVASNTALSKRRAESVRQVLIRSFGAAPGRVSAEGAGPLAPRDSNQTEDGRHRNRRVEAVPALT